ncbi:MAG: glycosyltransferase family 92 protein [Chlamydiia bacterium]|nr:glycosyltransferase family 92 protein [Chlamydiia bacterium]
MKKKVLLATFALLLVPLILVLNKPRYPLAICAIFHNEAPFLKEWIDYHHDEMGINKFYLYNNNSTDDYLSVLAPYMKSGVVQLIDWPSIEENAIHGFGEFQQVPYQHGAYQHCAEKIKGQVDWIAMIDIDEYIVPNMSAQAFYKLLEKEKKEKTGSLKIYWKVFGTSNIYTLNEGEKLIDHLVMRASEEHPWNFQIKSIHQPKALRRPLVHEAKKLHKGYLKKSLPKELCRIHHYWTGTENRFWEKRKGFTKEAAISFLEELNRVEDLSIQAFRLTEEKQ